MQPGLQRNSQPRPDYFDHDHCDYCGNEHNLDPDLDYANFDCVQNATLMTPEGRHGLASHPRIAP